MGLRLEDARGVDLYLLDLVLRGCVPEGVRVLDVGCGRGRNIAFFVRRGDEAFGIEPDGEALAATRRLVRRLGCPQVEERFRAESIETCTFPEASFDLVICNGVLHFARDRVHFRELVGRLRDLLRPGSLCFTRLASTIGLEAPPGPAPGRGEGWALMPDGTEHFLADLPLLLETTAELGVALEGSIKTVNVQNSRCMTTWVWRAPGQTSG